MGRSRLLGRVEEEWSTVQCGRCRRSRHGIDLEHNFTEVWVVHLQKRIDVFRSPWRGGGCLREGYIGNRHVARRGEDIGSAMKGTKICSCDPFKSQRLGPKSKRSASRKVAGFGIDAPQRCPISPVCSAWLGRHPV